MQGHRLDEPYLGTHRAVELGAIRQGGESISQLACGIAVEVPLAAEAASSGEDGEGNHLAGAERRIGPRRPLFLWAAVAEVVHDDVECSEEGVLKSSMGWFLSLWDRVASRL